MITALAERGVLPYIDQTQIELLPSPKVQPNDLLPPKKDTFWVNHLHAAGSEILNNLKKPLPNGLASLQYELFGQSTTSHQIAAAQAIKRPPSKLIVNPYNPEYLPGSYNLNDRLLLSQALLKLCAKLGFDPIISNLPPTSPTLEHLPRSIFPVQEAILYSPSLNLSGRLGVKQSQLPWALYLILQS